MAKKSKVRRTYDKMRMGLKTGDIVLFSGKGGISDWIKWFSSSSWSHVGMVLKLSGWDMLLLFESTTLNSIKDVETGRAVRGVQLVPLSERIKTYNGKIAIRRLSKAITEPMRKKLLKFRRSVSGRPYEKDYIELIRSAYDGPFGENKEDLSSLFCSELVAEAYQKIGMLAEPRKGKPHKGEPSNEYTPRDFSTEAKRPLKLLMGYKLGKEIRIQNPRRKRKK